jgi:hypothetical protein
MTALDWFTAVTWTLAGVWAALEWTYAEDGRVPRSFAFIVVVASVLIILGAAR